MMRSKIRNSLVMSVFSLTLFVSVLAGDTVSSDVQWPSSDSLVISKPALVAMYYTAPYRPTPAIPAVNVVPPQDTFSLSTDPEVDIRTLLIVVLGLIGMRLWRSGKRSLPAIG